MNILLITKNAPSQLTDVEIFYVVPRYYFIYQFVIWWFSNTKRILDWQKILPANTRHATEVRYPSSQKSHTVNIVCYIRLTSCPFLNEWSSGCLLWLYVSRAMRNMSYANNKGADQPAYPCSLISAFVVHCLNSVIYLDSIAEISRL